MPSRTTLPGRRNTGGFWPSPTPGGVPGAYDVPRMQCHVVAEVAHEERHAERSSCWCGRSGIGVRRLRARAPGASRRAPDRLSRAMVQSDRTCRRLFPCPTAHRPPLAGRPVRTHRARRRSRRRGRGPRPSDTYFAGRPMTTPNSTSQSVFTDPRGNTMSSLGPEIEDVAFMNTTGSFGTGMPDSAAWSESSGRWR